MGMYAKSDTKLPGSITVHRLARAEQQYDGVIMQLWCTVPRYGPLASRQELDACAGTQPAAEQSSTVGAGSRKIIMKESRHARVSWRHGWLMAIGLFLASCSTPDRPKNMTAFKQDLACSLSRKAVYNLVVKHDIDYYACEATRIRPPEAWVNFSCAARESLMSIIMKFDRNDKLQTIQIRFGRRILREYWKDFRT